MKTNKIFYFKVINVAMSIIFVSIFIFSSITISDIDLRTAYFGYSSPLYTVHHILKGVVTLFIFYALSIFGHFMLNSHAPIEPHKRNKADELILFFIAGSSAMQLIFFIFGFFSFLHKSVAIITLSAIILIGTPRALRQIIDTTRQLYFSRKVFNLSTLLIIFLALTAGYVFVLKGLYPTADWDSIRSHLKNA